MQAPLCTSCLKLSSINLSNKLLPCQIISHGSIGSMFFCHKFRKKSDKALLPCSIYSLMVCLSVVLVFPATLKYILWPWKKGCLCREENIRIRACSFIGDVTCHLHVPVSLSLSIPGSRHQSWGHLLMLIWTPLIFFFGIHFCCPCSKAVTKSYHKKFA